MKYMSIIIAISVFFASTVFAAHNIVLVDANGDDIADGVTSPVRTISRAVEIALSLERSEESPCLISIGQGSFTAPAEKWYADLAHVYFCGNGMRNTRIVAEKITIPPTAITGFKDIAIEAVMDIGDQFIPVENVRVMDVKKNTGQLDGIYYNAAGELMSTPSDPEDNNDQKNANAKKGDTDSNTTGDDGGSMPGDIPPVMLSASGIKFSDAIIPDDYTSLSSALSAGATNIYVRRGVHTDSNWNSTYSLTKPVQITGEDRETTALKVEIACDAPIEIDDDLSLVFNNITLILTNAGDQSTCRFIEHHNYNQKIVMRDVTIESYESSSAMPPRCFMAKARLAIH